MIYESYNPKDRQVSTQSQAAAWVLCVLLIGSVIAMDGIAEQNDMERHVVSERVVPVC